MRQTDQKLQLLLQTWAEPCKRRNFCFYINRAETREPSRVVSMATTRSVVNKYFFNAYMHTSPRFDSEVRFGARYRTVLLQAPV